VLDFYLNCTDDPAAAPFWQVIEVNPVETSGAGR
jgi:hypothetical protein